MAKATCSICAKLLDFSAFGSRQKKNLAMGKPAICAADARRQHCRPGAACPSLEGEVAWRPEAGGNGAGAEPDIHVRVQDLSVGTSIRPAIARCLTSRARSPAVAAPCFCVCANVLLSPDAACRARMHLACSCGHVASDAQDHSLLVRALVSEREHVPL